MMVDHNLHIYNLLGADVATTPVIPNVEPSMWPMYKGMVVAVYAKDERPHFLVQTKDGVLKEFPAVDCVITTYPSGLAIGRHL